MPKYGIEVQIDVSKIDKARIYEGKKGKYLTMTTFVDTDNKDQYDNNGFISHKQTKEESESKTNTPILGNVRVFWSDSPVMDSIREKVSAQNVNNVNYADFDVDDDSIPF